MLFKKNFVFLFLISLILLILQYLPYIYHVRQTPPDRIYLGAERYTPDYYIYLFYSNQGALNRTTVSDFYTNEPHEDSLVHEEYLVMGKIGHFLGLSVIATFYLFRSLFLIIYVVASFWFITKFIKDSLWQKLTLILSFFYSGFFWPQITNTDLNFKSFFDFYQPPDLINRLTFEPHKLMGMILFLIISYLFSSFWPLGPKLGIKGLVQNHTRKDSGVALLPRMTFFLLLLFLAGFIHGITTISLIFTVCFYTLFITLIAFLNKKGTRYIFSLISFTPRSLGEVGPVSLITLTLFLPLIYWQKVFSTNPVWYNVFYTWEKYFTNIDRTASLLPTITGYLFILGPLIFLSLIGLKQFLIENKRAGLFLLSFLLSNIFLFFIGYIFLGTSKHRFFQTPYLLVWSILATYGLIDLSRVILKAKRVTARVLSEFFVYQNNSWQHERWQDPSDLQRRPQQTFMIITTTILLLFGLPNFKQGLDRQLYQFGTPPNLEFLAYPSKDFYQGLMWLKNNTTTRDIILSLPTAGNIIPAIPGRKVVIGDYVHSYLYSQKLPLVTKFFKGEMTTIEAKNFLQKQKVSYIFLGGEEKKYGNLVYGFLTSVYENNSVIIYNFKP